LNAVDKVRVGTNGAAIIPFPLFARPEASQENFFARYSIFIYNRLQSAIILFCLRHSHQLVHATLCARINAIVLAPDSIDSLIDTQKAD
jgi:hypothetical protein